MTCSTMNDYMTNEERQYSFLLVSNWFSLQQIIGRNNRMHDVISMIDVQIAEDDLYGRDRETVFTFRITR